MRRGVWAVIFLLAAPLLAPAKPAHHAADEDAGTALKVGGLVFTIPERWEREPAESSARAAQWHIAPPRVPASEAAQVVVFFFGVGVGGTAQENMTAWAETVTAADGKPAAINAQTRQIAGHKITQVLLVGTYAQTSSQPGMPPVLKPAWGLLGAVVENPAGNIYWRVTGPVAQVTSLVPVVTKILDGLKPQELKP